MNHERPPKRTRQACEPCRRKKSKCSGDRPVCSTCNRLGQQCFYPREPPLPPLQPAAPRSPLGQQLERSADTDVPENVDVGRRWEDRIESLESVMSEVLQVLRSGSSNGFTTMPQQPTPEARIQQQSPQQSIGSDVLLTPGVVNLPSEAKASLPGWNRIIKAAELYRQFCDCQPLPMFHPGTFVASLQVRSHEILFSILAHAERFEGQADTTDVESRDRQLFMGTAQSLAMEKFINGQIDLSTLQTLCLLSFMYFQDGNSDRAIPLITLATALTERAGLRHEATSAIDTWVMEERRRCYWSINLLRRLFGLGFNSPPHIDSSTPLYPVSASSPTSSATPGASGQADTAEPRTQNGIVAVMIHLSEIWAKVMIYVRSCRAPDPNISPWSTSSKYMDIMSSLMDIDRHLSPSHRYRHVRVRDVTSEDLEHSREYWAPWLLTRFMYHTIICLLNHPLLITLQLQGRQHVPELFLQQTSFYVSKHSAWILHFIAFIESRSFRTSDPILGYCVAVLATIELHRSFSGSTINQERKQGFETCLQFIRSLENEWPSMKRMADKLQHITEAISVSYESNLSNPDGSISIDLSRFFDILDFANSSGRPGLDSTEGTMYQPSLISRGTPSATAQRVELSQLPAITQPDHTATANVTMITRATTGVQPPANSNDESSRRPENIAANSAPYYSRTEVTLSADQFFGGFFQEDMSTWFDMFGHPNSNMPP
ncbi:hypothetical protein BX600DRAFT_547061 [Xylariales sp. PMI_506]|nr:hypothetical protein BX600DRAFT_547061 [Xylariales sp. PMI_506]